MSSLWSSLLGVRDPSRPLPLSGRGQGTWHTDRAAFALTKRTCLKHVTNILVHSFCEDKSDNSFGVAEYLLNRTEPVLKSLQNLQTTYSQYSTDKEGQKYSPELIPNEALGHSLCFCVSNVENRTFVINVVRKENIDFSCHSCRRGGQRSV